MSDYLYDRVKRLEDRVENLEQGGYGSHIIKEYLGYEGFDSGGAHHEVLRRFMNWLGKKYKLGLKGL